MSLSEFKISSLFSSLIFVLALVLSSCNSQINKVASKNLTPEEQKSLSRPDFAAIHEVMETNSCFKCHDVGSDNGDLSTYSAVMNFESDEGYAVVPGHSERSALIRSLQNFGGKMPKKNPRMSDAEALILRTWIDEGAHEFLNQEASPSPAPSPSPSAGSPEPSPTLPPGTEKSPVQQPSNVTYAQVAPILSAKCTRCHSGVDADKDVHLESFDLIVKNSKIVISGQSENSILYTLARDNKMPPKPKKPNSPPRKYLSDEEKLILRDWIDGGLKPAP